MRVEIYSKPDCALCAEAKAVLHKLQARIPFELVEVNVELDPELHARYRYDIPVVVIDGHRAFKHRLEPDSVEDRLRRAIGKSSDVRQSEQERTDVDATLKSTE